MFTYEHVKDRPGLLRALTGLDRNEFEELREPFGLVLEARLQSQRRSESDCQRCSGGESKPALQTVADKLLFILHYLKNYPLQEIIGFEFGLSQERACEWVRLLTDEERPTFPPGSSLYQDTGFQAHEPAGVKIVQPKKKPRGKELSAADKQRNRRISKIRIVVEHVIAGVKRCRIVKDILRNLTHGFADLVMVIACGLHNFRMSRRSKRKSANRYFR